MKALEVEHKESEKTELEARQINLNEFQILHQKPARPSLSQTNLESFQIKAEPKQHLDISFGNSTE